MIFANLSVINLYIFHNAGVEMLLSFGFSLSVVTLKTAVIHCHIQCFIGMMLLFITIV